MSLFQHSNLEKADVTEVGATVDPEEKPKAPNPSIMKDGSDFRIVGEFKNPLKIVKCSTDFENIITVLQELKCDEKFKPEYEVTECENMQFAQRDVEVEEMRQKIAKMTEENARLFLGKECCTLLRDIGPPWEWLYIFASETCADRAYNFVESVASDMTPTNNDWPGSEAEDSFDCLNDKFAQGTNDDTKSSVSGGSLTFSLLDADNRTCNNHEVLIDTICAISESNDKGECSFKRPESIASFLEVQHSNKHLETSDYERLKMYIDHAQEQRLVFNDLNELYNYFIQESGRERSTHEVEIREEDENEAEPEIVIVSTKNTPAEIQPKSTETSKAAIEKAENKNVVAIFGESGIEVDGKLLDAKVSERMILGLVDKPLFEDNVSDDVASSVSSLSQAETVKMKHNVTREIDTQTLTYKEQIHSKRIKTKHAGKSKSASSIKRQPFACKIPQIPGIGPSMDDERLEKILHFITHRSFQQGGFVYPRNFLEDECPSMTA